MIVKTDCGTDGSFYSTSDVMPLLQPVSLLPTTLAEYEAALPELGRERVLQIFREVETAKEVKLGLCREFRQQLIWETEDGETLL